MDPLRDLAESWVRDVLTPAGSHRVEIVNPRTGQAVLLGQPRRPRAAERLTLRVRALLLQALYSARSQESGIRSQGSDDRG